MRQDRETEDGGHETVFSCLNVKTHIVWDDVEPKDADKTLDKNYIPLEEEKMNGTHETTVLEARTNTHKHQTHENTTRLKSQLTLGHFSALLFGLFEIFVIESNN